MAHARKSTRGAALAAFTEAKAEIDAMLARLTAASADHFEIGPDEVNWGGVGALDEIRAQLCLVCGAAFGEGEGAQAEATLKACVATGAIAIERPLYREGSAAALMAAAPTPSEIAGYARFKRAKEILKITRSADLHGLVGGPDLGLDHLAERLAILLWGEA